MTTGKTQTSAAAGSLFDRWREAYARAGEREAALETVSSAPVTALATPADVAGTDWERDVGLPGQFPYTRGPYASMYRGRLWTMRQFAGFGSAADTNARYKYLLEHGQDGLSVAFDLPTLMGYDADHPRAAGEVGRCGVAVSSLRDMETLFDGIALADITTSMTINSPAAIIWAMYLVTAQKQGARLDQLGGTTQNDILKEYIAQKEYIFPPAPSMRLVVDTIEFATNEMPLWHAVSISGYHIREAGSTAVQEVAFTLADGITYVESALDAGLSIDEFAPRISFFFNAHNNLLEEIAKFRAARRLWARIMRDRFKARDPRSLMLRFHTQTAGSSLTAQQPEVNVVRTTIQALAAVLGGTQSLHTNSMDEALALPTEDTARVALRTQQVIAHESGVADTVDPLAGSYAIEELTNQVEQRAEEYLNKIDDMGGMLRAIETGYVQREIQESAYRYQKAIESQDEIVVGVNRFQVESEPPTQLLRIDPALEQAQVERVRALRARRDEKAVEGMLQELERAAATTENLMPRILACVESYATVGEISNTLRRVWGEYRETSTV